MSLLKSLGLPPQPSRGGGPGTATNAHADSPVARTEKGANQTAPSQRGAAPQKGPATAPIAKPVPKPLGIITASGATQLLAGSTERFRVTATLPNGSAQDVTGDVTWNSSDPGISISATGYADVRAAAGRLTLTATHAATGATGSITITVVTRLLRKITISPRNPMFEVDNFEPLRASGEFSDNTIEDVTDRVVWESRNEKVARMLSDGHCHTKAPGNADIWASDPAVVVIDTIKVTVNAAGKAPKLVRLHVAPVDPTVSDFAPLQFTASGDFADNSSHEVTDRVRWVSTKPDTLAIDERSGLASPGLVADTAWVTAVDDATAVNARSEVTVNVPKLESIVIAPRDLSPHKGETVTVTVTGTFSNRTTDDLTRRVTWSSSNQATAGVVPLLNQVFGADVGPPVEISARVPNFPDVGDSITVTVLPAVVTSIEIAPGDTTLQVRGKQTFAATAVFSDARREVLSGRNVKWSCDDEKAVVVDQKGEASAKGPGTARVTATHPASRRSESVVVVVETPD